MTFKLAVILTLLFIGSTLQAYAYIDPATGSIILQGLLALLAGTAFFFRGQWHKVRNFFAKKNAPATEASDAPTVPESDA